MVNIIFADRETLLAAMQPIDSVPSTHLKLYDRRLILATGSSDKVPKQVRDDEVEISSR